MSHSIIPELKIHLVTPKRWKDFAKLFGKKGACGGCWCMFWRLTRSEFEKRKGEKNRRAMKNIIDSGQVPGLIAYADTEPVGWCSVGPRENYSALERSRVLKPVDDRPVWSIVCFYIARGYRRQGVTVALLKAAIEYAKSNGTTIVEGYPIDPKKKDYVDTFAYTGLVSAFKKAGFKEVARHSETRPIMRYIIKK
ncbi:MAG: GNAT family N-acetyltransferase [candidate division Zixibacteria bacterium]|nr:GNAT family N-acetyltransferase [candidate division Zixibacteria bacterium]